jgi:hypothetical protein
MKVKSGEFLIPKQMKKGIGFLVMALWSLSVMSQGLPKKSFMRLQGYLNDQVEVMMNLVKMNDSLYADYYLSIDNGTPQVAGGMIADDGSFTLRTPFDPAGTEIRGKFITRQTMTGTWEMEKGGSKYKFSLSENYPSGSIPLSVWFQVATKPLVSKSANPRAYIEQCLIVPGESSDPILSDTIRKKMMALFASKESTATDPQFLLNSLQQSFFGSYMADNLQLYKQIPDAGSLNWDLYKLVHVVYNDFFLLSFYIDSYAFTGGAHGLGAQDYTVIYMKTGKIVTSADLFIKDYEPVLTSILTAKLKKMEKLQPLDKLSEKAEYFVDEIPPNSNFYITGHGIGFLYNHYEIAPYSHGFTDIFLTFDELRPVIKSGGLLEPLLK